MVRSCSINASHLILHANYNSLILRWSRIEPNNSELKYPCVQCTMIPERGYFLEGFQVLQVSSSGKNNSNNRLEVRKRKQNFSFLSAFGIISTSHKYIYIYIYRIAYGVNIHWPRIFENKEKSIPFPAPLSLCGSSSFC